MGVDCYGWVEVCDPDWHSRDAPTSFVGWRAVVKIDDIVERNYRVYGFFFGVHDPTHVYTAVAGRRGLPPHVSEEVRLEFDNDDDAARSAASWVLWSELKASNWQSTIELTAGWKLLFTLMESLADQYGEQRVRLVIWFDQSVFL
jgi:hypothetical protein